ncbi:MAG: siroheme synthase CysG [Gammaproteobacteria bacterium]
MDYLPIFFDVKDRRCLVVGGGEIAARKVARLRSARASVHVVAPELCPSLANDAAQGLIDHWERRFHPDDLADCALVVAATDDAAVNHEVSESARARGIPVNVVDQPALCSFIMPSIIDRAPVIVAVSSSGASPVLARLLRARLETLIPAAYGHLAALVETFRTQVKARFAVANHRRRFWEDVLDGPVAEMVFAGKDQEARDTLAEAIQNRSQDGRPTGAVYLVGAGPGDPDLLSFRALRVMQQADVVLYDRLVTKDILDLARRDAERIYVGKKRAQHAVRQGEINQMMLELAQQGNRVLRLKGGDPFIFGRGGEEIDSLSAHGIPFQVVPGITAASGCAAYAGIPLTHRDYAQSCVFVTGQLKNGSIDLNWPMLAQPQQTIVCYMGLAGIELLCKELIAHGMPGEMPAALIEQGTTRRQRTFVGTLSTLASKVQDSDVHAPTLIIIGDVVRLHDKLTWFEPEAKATGDADTALWSNR